MCAHIYYVALCIYIYTIHMYGPDRMGHVLGVSRPRMRS